LLFNLGTHQEDILIKLLESFSSGGWKRIYSILLNLVSRMLEENGDFSFENVFDDIKDYSKYHDILTVGFPQCSRSSEI
jgi:hypothetical protein